MAAQQVEALFLVLLVGANLLGAHTADVAQTTPTQPPESSTDEPEAVDPFLEDLCIIENSTEAYRVNTEWTEDACEQKCRCVFRSTPMDDTREVLLLKTINMNTSSELTEIRCTMPPKCGPIENRVHQASKCARPLLAFSNGEPCSCPRLYCADNITFTPTRPSTTQTLVSSTTGELAAPTTSAASKPAASASVSTTTPVPTTNARPATLVATVGPSILQPVKSATASQRPTTTTTTTSTATTTIASPSEPVSVGSPATVTEAPVRLATSTASLSTTTTTNSRQANSVPTPISTLSLKNFIITSQRSDSMLVSTTSPPEPPVNESITTSGGTTLSAASPTTPTTTTVTTTTTTSDSSTHAPNSDNPIVPAIVTSATLKPDPGCTKKGLDELETSNFEECQSVCRCENNKLKCGNSQDGAPIVPSQSIDLEPLAWTQQIQSRMNVQKYAWHLLVGFVSMSIMFTILLFMYMKKTTFVMTSLAAQTGYDNASYNSRLVSYYANQPHVLMVDETNQNFNNAAIIARQKNLEVDKASPLHPQNRRLGEIHHPSGRQHLI